MKTLSNLLFVLVCICFSSNIYASSPKNEANTEEQRTSSYKLELFTNPVPDLFIL